MTNSLRQHLVDPVDILLADVAIRIQLSRTDYNKAVQRYQTISNWIERDGSPLKDRVELFYPQGSMAIGATIASKLKDDEFDIDVVSQLDSSVDGSPGCILDLLYEAIRGKPGSKYYGITRRRTRCITVDYGDDMHLDVTPTLRMDHTPERQSWIFDHQQETPYLRGRRLIANPYGFAEWFKDSTPPDDRFADIFEERAREYELQRVLAEADSDSVPPQEPPHRKSKALIVLQLLKRWRNVQYDTRPGRRPPSITIAKLVAEAAGDSTQGLCEELLFQARNMLSIFRQSYEQGQLIHIVNPMCGKDVLTDRWPACMQDQALFIRDLEGLEQRVERLVNGCDLQKMQEIMASLFGETPVKAAIHAFNRRAGNSIGNGRSRYNPQNGGLIVAPSVPSITRTTPRHTFYGTERRKR